MSGNTKKLKERNEISNDFKWNLEAMYANDDLWEKDYRESSEAAKKYASYQGRLGDSAETLFRAFEDKSDIWQKIEKAYVYAHMRKDEDNRNAKYQAMIDRCQSLISNASAEMAFFTPELLSLPEDKVLGYVKEYEPLKKYEFAIICTLREKDHVLPAEQEKLLAQVGEVLSATNDIYTMLNNADMKFGEITDEDGETVTLTHGNFITFMESHKRSVRKEAFEKKYKAYEDLKNTLATTYNYNTKTDVIGAKIRSYPSALDASLYGDNIPKSVYENLLASVNANLGSLHKYLSVRQRLLTVDELHMYDVYVPLFEIPKRVISYAEATDTVKSALSILGPDYSEKLAKGISEGWVDVYENAGKTSGAYSFGSYDSFPYVLMNYSETIKDVFTLAHELGHSMHSLYTRAAQPFIYGGHSIFTAEVASTVNENLLMKQLLSNEKDMQMKKYLLNFHLEEFRATVFRQTMFAEFEKLTHEAVENGEVLTSEWLCDKYEELNSKYFGKNVVMDHQIRYEWSRIPHFYNAFYVYMYATGYSAASAISDMIIEDNSKGSTAARDAYIEFLKSGESNYPIELLKIAGVDMGSKAPVDRALKVFADMVDQLDELTK